MNRATRLALAVGLPVIVLATAGRPALADPPPTGVFPPPSGTVPADWSWLVDDTATIAIRVPSTWTAVDSTPLQIDGGEPLPTISATTDEDLFFPVGFTAESSSVPGVIFSADSFEADTAAPLTHSPYRALCTTGPVQRFDDGLFVGHIQFFDNCSGTTSRIVEVAANPADDAFTLHLLVQLTGQPDDDTTLDGLLSSFATVDDHATTTDGATTADDDPVVGVVQHIVQDEFGVTITDEQAHCLLDTVMYIDASAVYAALYTCGVDVLDLPSG